jgi:hypothetical protein
MDNTEIPDHCQRPLYLSQQGYLLKFQVALALVFLGHEEQGVLQMGGSGKKFISLFFLIVPLHVAKAKVAVITMISWFPSDHWDLKTKRLFLTFGPLPQFFNIKRAHLMRSP